MRRHNADRVRSVAHDPLTDCQHDKTPYYFPGPNKSFPPSFRICSDRLGRLYRNLWRHHRRRRTRRNPAWQLTSNPSMGMGYSGVFLNVMSALTPSSLTQLSASYTMLSGTFGPGAPTSRSSTGAEEPPISTGERLRQQGALPTRTRVTQTTAAPATMPMPRPMALRVESNGFGGFSSGTFPYHLGRFPGRRRCGGHQIQFITVDLDAGLRALRSWI